MELRVFLSTFLVFFPELDLVYSATRCPPHSSWEPNCERTCAAPQLCGKVRNMECFCVEGFFRDMDTGACVPKHKCPVRRRNNNRCPARSTTLYRCEKSCDYRKCERKLTNRCLCRPLYFRDPITYNCVSRKMCSVPDTMERRSITSIFLFLCLGIDLVYCAVRCYGNSSWELSCERKCDAKATCRRNPEQECFCKEGYFRDRRTGGCVKAKDCSRGTGSGICPARSTYKLKCEKTCDYRKCIPKLDQTCFCRDLYYRDPLTNKCVLKHKCSVPHRKCSIKYPRPNRCERTCKDRVCRPRIGRACHCNAGYYRDLTDGRCVKFLQCPRPNCSPNLHCEARCDNPYCNSSIKRHCYCKHGLYRNPLTLECVTLDECVPFNLTTWYPTTSSTPSTIRPTQVSVSTTTENWQTGWQGSTFSTVSVIIGTHINSTLPWPWGRKH